MRKIRCTEVAKIIALSLAVFVVTFIASQMAMSNVQARGNQAWFDSTYTFDKAIINTFDGSITVQVKSWKEWDDNNTVQVITTDGKVYYTNSENVILMATK